MIIKFKRQEMKMNLISIIGGLMSLWAFVEKVDSLISYGTTYKKTKNH